MEIKAGWRGCQVPTEHSSAWGHRGEVDVSEELEWELE